MNTARMFFTQSQMESSGWRKLVTNKGYGHYEYKNHDVFISNEEKKNLYANEINRLYWEELMNIDRALEESKNESVNLPSYEDNINYFFEMVGIQ